MKKTMEQKTVNIVDYMELVESFSNIAQHCNTPMELHDVLNVLQKYFKLMELVQNLPLRLRLVYWAMTFKTYCWLRMKHQLKDAKQCFDEEVVTTFKAAVRRLLGGIEN